MSNETIGYQNVTAVSNKRMQRPIKIIITHSLVYIRIMDINKNFNIPSQIK